MNIKELREKTGLTQKKFADTFGIPLGTIRRWEYGESTPAPYVLRLIAEKIPAQKEALQVIPTGKGTFYYDEKTNQLLDSVGNSIQIKVSLSDVKKQNLSNYVEDLFDTYYDMLNKFERACVLDKKEDILWE